MKVGGERVGVLVQPDSANQGDHEQDEGCEIRPYKGEKACIHVRLL